jgi:hypothetical protein
MAVNAAQDPPQFIPRIIQRQLDNPPILPGENASEFRSLFRGLEMSAQQGGRTPADYTMIYQATTLTWRVIGLERMRAALIQHQRPAAVVALIRRTNEFGGAERGSIAYMTAPAEAIGYFKSDDARKKIEASFAAAGYAQECVDVETFQLSLLFLTTIDRQIASAQKQLMAFLKEIDRRESRRAHALRKAALNAISHARSPVAEKGKAS